MPSVKTTIFTAVFSIESIVIFIGNAITIFVFWSQRFHLKRLRLKHTYMLLSNLAIADFLVGVSTGISFLSRTFRDLIKRKHFSFMLEGDVFVLLFLLFGSTSLFCLVVISLERLYAIVRPLRHRTTRTRVYMLCIAASWMGGFLMTAINFATMTGIWTEILWATLVIDVILLFSVLTICASYFIIRLKMRCKNPRIGTCGRKTIEQNLKLSKTLLIVSALSVLCWLPSILVYAAMAICDTCVSRDAVLLEMVLNTANSAVNPFVYTFRMPMFRASIKKVCCKRR